MKSYNKNYVAIIADIKDSKHLKDRNVVQSKLREQLSLINKKYKDNIASNFLITLGDEFQGLLLNGEYCLEIIQQIKMALYPVELRYGIGIGEISTEIDRSMALAADGPAYHCAREAVEHLKLMEKKKKVKAADIYLCISDCNTNEMGLINVIFDLMSVIEKGWTKRQREIINDMYQHQDSQIKVAQRQNIEQSTVQKALSAGHYYSHFNALQKVKKILGEYQYVEI